MKNKVVDKEARHAIRMLATLVYNTKGKFNQEELDDIIEVIGEGDSIVDTKYIALNPK